MIPAAVDLEKLLKLRLVVARFGEMDKARWWNTRGQLGRLGTTAVRRGFPRTHYFAQARAVFAVAAYRCRELFDTDGVVTLWQLPPLIEDQFEARWEHWLDHAAEWTDLFQGVESLPENDLIAALRAVGAVTDRDLEALARIPRSAGARAFALPNPFSGTNEGLAQTRRPHKPKPQRLRAKSPVNNPVRRQCGPAPSSGTPEPLLRPYSTG
jgi:hypothetical protein